MSSNLSVRLGRLAFAMAEVSSEKASFVIAVVDVYGNPWPGVNVTLDSFLRYSAVTDSKGIARFTFPLSDGLGNLVLVNALTPTGEMLQQQVDVVAGQQTPTLFRFSVEQPKPILTTLEAVVLAGGIIVAAIGFYKDNAIGNVVGGLGSSLAASAVLSSAKRHIWG